MKKFELKFVGEHWDSVERFLGYVEEHSKTQRALFSRAQVAEMCHLHGEEGDGDDVNIEWQSVDFTDWVSEIRHWMEEEENDAIDNLDVPICDVGKLSPEENEEDISLIKGKEFIPPGCIKIPFDGIYWNIQAYPKREEKTNKPLIRLEWGWSAGMDDEQRMKSAEAGNPVGYNTVTTTPEMAKMLIWQLEKIIKDFEDEN